MDRILPYLGQRDPFPIHTSRNQSLNHGYDCAHQVISGVTVSLFLFRGRLTAP